MTRMDQGLSCMNDVRKVRDDGTKMCKTFLPIPPFDPRFKAFDNPSSILHSIIYLRHGIALSLTPLSSLLWSSCSKASRKYECAVL